MSSHDDETPTDDEQIAHLRISLHTVWEMCQIVHGACYHNYKLETIAPVTPEEFAGPVYKCFHPYLNTKFFTLKFSTVYVEEISESTTVHGNGLFKDFLLKAARAYNNCVLDAAVSSVVISRLLKNDPYIDYIQWCSCKVNPRVVFFERFPHQDSIPEAQIIWHDVIRLVLYSGQKLIFDPSGIQFGFEEWLTTEEEYMSNYVWPTSSPDVDPTDENFGVRDGRNEQTLDLIRAGMMVLGEDDEPSDTDIMFKLADAAREVVDKIQQHFMNAPKDPLERIQFLQNPVTKAALAQLVNDFGEATKTCNGDDIDDDDHSAYNQIPEGQNEDNQDDDDHSGDNQITEGQNENNQDDEDEDIHLGWWRNCLGWF